MSKQRQRARATREADARAAARAKAAKKREGGTSAPQLRQAAAGKAPGKAKARGKQTVYRQRRFPPLPLFLELGLAVGWLAVQVLIFLTVEPVGLRIALGIISLFALPLIVVLVRDPSRRKRH